MQQPGQIPNVEQITSNARSLNREIGNLTEQVAAAQVAAARALFNMQNAWSFGSMTPLAGRFEEGLNLYERTVHDLQDSRDKVAESMFKQVNPNTQRQTA